MSRNKSTVFLEKNQLENESFHKTVVGKKNLSNLQ